MQGKSKNHGKIAESFPDNSLPRDDARQCNPPTKDPYLPDSPPYSPKTNGHNNPTKK